MTRVDGKTLVIESTPPSECSICHRRDECRPYGFDGASICHPCMKADPALMAEAQRRFKMILDRTDGVGLVVSEGAPTAAKA